MASTASSETKDKPAPCITPSNLIECIQDGKAFADMRITVRMNNGVTVLDILGRLDSSTLTDAEGLLLRLIDEGETKIVVNFELLQYISSGGFRFLLLAARWLKEAGGSLRICAVSGNVREIFDISGFATLFDIFPDETSALARF